MIDYNDLAYAYCNDKDFVKWLNDVSRSRDGFHSFCSGIENVKQEPSILMEYIFQYIIWHDGSEPYDSEELQAEILENITCNGGAEIYFNEIEKEKFECNDCGCYYMVKDRSDFDCPNCEDMKETNSFLNQRRKKLIGVLIKKN